MLTGQPLLVVSRPCADPSFVFRLRFSGSQVVVSGPAGFVFHVEGLLVDLNIPPEAVVTLD